MILCPSRRVGRKWKDAIVLKLGMMANIAEALRIAISPGTDCGNPRLHIITQATASSRILGYKKYHIYHNHCRKKIVKKLSKNWTLWELNPRPFICETNFGIC